MAGNLLKISAQTISAVYSSEDAWSLVKSAVIKD
jgi:hypothetical protein